MAIAHQFAYHKAATLDEAVEVLTRAGPTARVLAGGTDLVPWMRDDAHPETVVDIKAIDALDEISLEGNHLYLGPLVTFSDLLTSELVAGHLPILREMADTVASPGIRNRAGRSPRARGGSSHHTDTGSRSGCDGTIRAEASVRRASARGGSCRG